MAKSFLKMKTDDDGHVGTDLREIGEAVKRLAVHAISLGSLGFGTSILEWAASIAAIYLLILDRTNWKTNILTSLLIPYIFLSLPSLIFNIFRGSIGRWIAFVAVVLRLFFPKRLPGWCDGQQSRLDRFRGSGGTAEWLELPCALILLIVVAPDLVTYLRGSWIGVAICLAIGAYLLQEHIRASGGFRNSFTKANGVSNSVGILVLVVYPVWRLVWTII